MNNLALEMNRAMKETGKKFTIGSMQSLSNRFFGCNNRNIFPS
jgi:hypothetical protein